MYNYNIRTVATMVSTSHTRSDNNMAKWNPCSKVNANHLLTIALRGTDEYLKYVSTLTDLTACDEPELLEIAVANGVESGYLPADAQARMFPTEKNVTAVADAAAHDAKVDMITQLLTDGLTGAVSNMLDCGLVTEANVATAKNRLGLE